MNTPRKKRGRPKSENMLEKERIDNLLNNPPEHIKISTQQANEQNEWVHSLQDYLKKLHGEFSPTISHRISEDLASISDDSMSGYEKQILDAYNRAENILANGQKNGAQLTAKNVNERAHSVWGKNPDLIRRIKSKNLSIHGAAIILHNEWNTRGDEEGKPTIRTLSNWYRRI